MSADQVCPVARMEKLLLASDRSEFSEGAIREAINLAKTCGSKLYIMSVAEEPDIREFAANYPLVAAQELERVTRVYLESLKERAEKEGAACEIIERRGPKTYEYIIDEAAKNNAEMIIMGRRGRTGITRILMGSVTARVIGDAPCKVLVVPRSARISFEKILISTDGSIFSEFATREAISIAKNIGSSLIALSVYKRDENSQVAEASVGMVKDVAEREGIKVEALTLKGEPYEVIVNTAEEKDAGFIVVGSHGRTGIERLLMGSVAERVIGYAGCPILVVRRP
ncbi:MAG: universal stress protein [Deltaproteobacteria bacterium]|nr:MAG: universal stress protein [Deltaproteobacteria bacterium]